MKQYFKPTIQVIEFEISNIIASSGSSSSRNSDEYGYDTPSNTPSRSGGSGGYSKSNGGYSKGGGYKKK